MQWLGSLVSSVMIFFSGIVGVSQAPVFDLGNGMMEYKNQDYNFSLNFPSNLPAVFEVNQPTSDGQREGIITHYINLPALVANASAGNPSLTIEVDKPQGSLGYMIDSPEKTYPSNITITSQEVDVGGTQGYLLIEHYPTSPPKNHINLGSGVHDGYKLDLLIGPYVQDGDLTKYTSLLKQIAQSIKFTG